MSKHVQKANEIVQRIDRQPRMQVLNSIMQLILGEQHLKCACNDVDVPFTENFRKTHFSTVSCPNLCQDVIRLIVIIWRPLEHISAPSSKTVGDREKSLRVACQVPRELPFSDIATAQWLTTRPVETRVCMYPTDRLSLR